MTFGGVLPLPNCNWFYWLVAVFVVATLQPPNPSTAVANNPDQANHGNPLRMRLRSKQGQITSLHLQREVHFLLGGGESKVAIFSAT